MHHSTYSNAVRCQQYRYIALLRSNTYLAGLQVGGDGKGEHHHGHEEQEHDAYTTGVRQDVDVVRKTGGYCTGKAENDPLILLLCCCKGGY